MISSLEVVHPDLDAILPKYYIVKDCIDGELAVKERLEEYLPVPADSNIDSERYRSYVQRANFTEFTQKTLDALLGNVFIRKPRITLPEQMRGLEMDVNGQGLTITQLAKELMAHVMAYGRAAIQVQYNPQQQTPTPGGALSIADVNNSPLPTLTSVSPFDLLNWIGTPNVNTVVIRERYEYRVSETSFEIEHAYQYRVWQLDPNTGMVSMYLYREGEEHDAIIESADEGKKPTMGMDEIKAMGEGSDSGAGMGSGMDSGMNGSMNGGMNGGMAGGMAGGMGGGGMAAEQPMTPDPNMPILGDGVMPIESLQGITTAAGQPINRLPIFIIGSENNDYKVDAPPLYGLSALNLSHYRNSADYEEAVYIAGQPTFFVTGVDPDWAEENLEGGELKIGSRALISLPAGATAGILQSQTNNLPFEAMKFKEKQMIALGATLLEEAASGGRRTATEIAISNLTKNASLASASENTATAIKQALQMAAVHMGANPDEVDFQLELTAGLMSITSQQQQSIIQFVQNQIITLTEARTIIQRDGWIAEVHNPDLVAPEAEELLLEEEGAGEATEEEGNEEEDPNSDDASADGGTEGDESEEAEGEEEAEAVAS